MENNLDVKKKEISESSSVNKGKTALISSS